MIVVDSLGGSEALLLCALSTLTRQMARESHVDVYAYARAAHRRKPGVWRGPGDYLALYKMLESHHEDTRSRECVEELNKQF